MYVSLYVFIIYRLLRSFKFISNAIFVHLNVRSYVIYSHASCSKNLQFHWALNNIQRVEGKFHFSDKTQWNLQYEEMISPEKVSILGELIFSLPLPACTI